LKEKRLAEAIAVEDMSEKEVTDAYK